MLNSVQADARTVHKNTNKKGIKCAWHVIN